MAEQTRLLEIRDLKKHFTVKKSGLGKNQTVKAVDGVSTRRVMILFWRC